MIDDGASRRVPLARWLVGSVVALGLALMCGLFGVSPAAAGMAGPGTTGSSVVAGSVAVTPVAMDMPCDDVCVSEVATACVAPTGLALVTVLGLLVAGRRDTYLGLVARAGPRGVLARRRALAPPWTVKSSVLDLCVIRV